MDPNIMKLLEEDEDETMHSGADVEAFTAALNRDIEGASTSQTTQSITSSLSQDHNQTSSQMYSQQWQHSTQEESSNSQIKKQDQSSAMEVKELRSDVEAPSGLPIQYRPIQVDSNKHNIEQISGESTPTSAPTHMQISGIGHAPAHEPDKMLNPGSNSQFSNMQRLTHQPVTAPTPSPVPMPGPEQGGNSANRGKQIPFGSLLPIILPELDKDRAIQLQTLYTKLRKNEIPKEGFVRHMRSLVGDQMLKLAVIKMQAKGNKNQEGGPLGHQIEKNVKAKETEHLTDPHTKQPSQTSGISIQGLSNQQQQHIHFPQSFPMYGANSYHPYTGSNIGTSSTMVKPQGYDPNVERQNSFNEPKRVLGTTVPNMSTQMAHNSVPWQPMVSKEQKIAPSGYVKQECIEQAHEKQPKPQTFSAPGSTLSSADTDVQVGPHTTSGLMGGPGVNAKASAAKKPLSGQKKPLDAHISSPPLSSKKQKVTGGFSDQSIEHLNDVTAVSGVNLREEEEQLFSGSKDDSRASEAFRKTVQEEEDRLIFQKIPLQKKIAEIMTKCGLKNLSNDVERCLSLCVEERLRGLISRLVRISKQRANSEKSRHNTVVTSDVREQILAINQKAKEEWEKQQAEAEKLLKPNEADISVGVDVDKENDEGRGKALKVNRDDDDKMRTTAANVAARAAVGGDDMLSKWQLMAQNRQKRDVGPDVTSSLGTSASNVRDARGSGKKDQSASSAPGTGKKQFGKNQAVGVPPRVARSVSIKDVIAVLEREPQMAKSTIIYRLYERLRTNDAAPPSL